MSNYGMPQPPPQPSAIARGAGEFQSQVTLQDFAGLIYRYRAAYLIGLLLVMGLTFSFVKFAMVKYYRSEALFFVGSRFTPESLRPGLAEAQVAEGSRNEMYQTVVQAQLVDELLRSSKLVLAVAHQLRETTETHPVDVFKLMGIDEKDPYVRDAKFVEEMRGGLIKVSQLQTSGLISYWVELPDRTAAKRFAELSLRKLEKELDELNWGYFDKALEIYEQQLANEMQRRERMALELTEFDRKHGLDRIPVIEEQRRAMEQKLNLQATTIAELSKRIESLRTATSTESKAAGQPFSVINEPQIPLKKSRPRTILATLGAGFAYSFVFLCGLLLIGLLGAGRVVDREYVAATK